MREGRRRWGPWIVVTGILCPGPAFADDPPPSPVPAQAAKAKARLAAKDYTGAFKVYAALIDAERDVDRETLVDAADAACLAVRPLEARTWKARALRGAPEEFLASAKGKLALDMDARIEAAFAQKAVDDRARAATYVAAAIKALSHDQEMLKATWLEPGAAAPAWWTALGTGERAPYGVRVDVIEAEMLRGFVGPSADGRNVRAFFEETFTDKGAAEARMRAIAADMRGQKSSWDRQFRLRTAKEKYEIREISDARYGEPADFDMVDRSNIVTFAWNVPGRRTMPSAATVELKFPLESKTDPKKNGKEFRVRTWLDSQWFK